MHAAEDARTEAARLAEQLADEKRAAAEQRAAIERREHEVLALLQEVEAKSAGSTAKPQDGATLLVQRQASHTAVATFWADFKPVPPHAQLAAALSAGTAVIVAGATATASAVGSSEIADAEEHASEEAVDTQASAMREALAATRAEVEAAKREESTVPRSGLKEKTPSSGKKRKAGNSPVKFTREMAHGAVPGAPPPQPAPVVASIDLDPETANKLRMMRRLNPSKSDQELLARISQEVKKPGKAKPKKGWFALK
jgi:hypothetical protein